VLEKAPPPFHALDFRANRRELALDVERVLDPGGALQDLQELRLELTLVVNASVEIDEFLAHVLGRHSLGAGALSQASQCLEGAREARARHAEREQERAVRAVTFFRRRAALGAGHEPALALGDAGHGRLSVSDARDLELE
jgi:hypothetical protein